MDDNLPDLLNSTEFGDANLSGAHSPENLFSILENLENGRFTANANTELNSLNTQWKLETDVEESPSCKRLKRSGMATSEQVAPDGPNRISHIIIERNRRKQMNEHLSVLRSLMPCFYTKRGDQASIIGGVVDFIKELQQVLQSLEAKKQRKTCIEVLSPRTGPLSPRPLPLSPRGSLPISPRTPQPVSPCNPRVHQLFQSPTRATSHELSYSDKLMEFAADSKSSIADVEVKFSGPNVLVKTMSRRIPGQALKIVTALEGLSLEILQASIGTVDDTMLNSFTIKIGVDCKLSAEELALQVQQTFF